MKPELQNRLKALPQVGHLLESDELRQLTTEHSHDLVKYCCEQVVNRARQTILQEKGEAPTDTVLIANVQQSVQDFLKPRLKRVINATGILLHTGLGRAPLLSEAYLQAFSRVAGSCNLELDLETGQRGDRQSILEELLRFITRAQSAAVVNNNAGAVLIALNTLANHKETLVARGQLIEIGGSFRLPEVMRKSGTRLIEVGTTNRTYLKDYEEAINPKTKAILVAHSSNYRIKGFVHEEEIKKIVALCRQRALHLIHDLGGGVVVDLKKWDLPPEPIVQESIAAGVHVVTFSGDKILGGPQAGIIVGDQETINAIRKNPLMRALRPDKFTLALLEETLKIYLSPQKLLDHHPVLKNLRETQAEAWSRAEAIYRLVAAENIPSDLKIEVVKTKAQLGSGALPLEEFPSAALRIKSSNAPITQIARQLRLANPPVIGYVNKKALYLDVKAITEDDIFLFTRSLLNVLLRIN